MRKFCLKLEWDEAYVCRFSEKQSEPLLDISYPSLPLFWRAKKEKEEKDGENRSFFVKSSSSSTRPLFQIEKKKSSSQQQQQQHNKGRERECVCVWRRQRRRRKRWISFQARRIRFHRKRPKSPKLETGKRRKSTAFVGHFRPGKRRGRLELRF